jgi:integrase/recombinase XerD
MISQLNYKIVLRNRDKKGFRTIYLQCIIGKKGNEQFVRINTGLKVRDKDFNKIKEVVRNSHPNAGLMNKVIGKFQTAANEVDIKYMMNRRRLTADILRKEILNPASVESFLDFYNREMNNRYNSRKIAWNTFRDNRVTLNKLRKFKNEIRFDEINVQLLEEFILFCQTEFNNGQSIISNSLKNIRTYLNLAQKSGRIVENPFTQREIKIPPYKKRLVWLTLEERNKLEEYFLSSFISRRHKNVLKTFLFQCWTGLRFSDVERIDRSNIKGQTLVFIPHKTRRFSKEISVPLNDRALKYIDSESKTLFPNLISNQKTNKTLKEIGKICSINKDMTTHIARHTFASLFIKSGGQVTTLKEILGHADIKETMIYVHVNDVTKRREMDAFANQ